MKGYANLFARSRAPVLGFVLTMSALALHGTTRLEIKDVPRDIFGSDDAAFARLLEIYEDFGTDDNDALLVLQGADWFGLEALAFAESVVERASAVPGVENVVWMGSIPVFGVGLLPKQLATLAREDPERARELAHSHPLIGERLISARDDVALVLVRLAGELLSIDEIQPSVVELRRLVDEVGEDEGLPDGAAVRLTGIPPIRVDIFHIVRSDQLLFSCIGAVLCILTAAVLFRSIGAVVCTTVPPAVGALWAYGMLGLLGVKLDLLSGILFMLVIVIGLTDAIHLMIDVRISRARGVQRIAAGADAIRHLGVPCALTSLTTAVGFGSLGIASVPAIRDFGLMAAGSVVLGFLAVITVVPLMSTWFESVGAAHVDDRSSPAAWTRSGLPLVRAMMKRRRRVAIAGFASIVTLGWLALRLQPENRLTEALPHGEAYQALEVCEEAFGGVLPSYVLVDWGERHTAGSPEVLEAVDRVAAVLGAIDELGRPLSFLDFVDAVPRGRERPAATLALLPDGATDFLLREDLGRALVIAPVPDEGSDVVLPIFEHVQSELRELASELDGIDLHLTGTDYIARSNVNRMIDDLARSLSFAALVIFGVIALEFRSLRIGLVSLLPNVFPLVLVGGVLKLSGAHLQMASAVLFTVLLGLAVDDTIHFLFRHRREQERHRGQAAIESAFLSVGQAILATTIVLVVAFTTVGLSEVPTNRMFAALAVLGLCGALIGDLFLLPTLLCFVRQEPKALRE